jgi:hypothetical protein
VHHKDRKIQIEIDKWIQNKIGLINMGKKVSEYGKGGLAIKAMRRKGL